MHNVMIIIDNSNTLLMFINVKSLQYSYTVILYIGMLFSINQFIF